MYALQTDQGARRPETDRSKWSEWKLKPYYRLTQ